MNAVVEQNTKVHGFLSGQSVARMAIVTLILAVHVNSSCLYSTNITLGPDGFKCISGTKKSCDKFEFLFS